MEVSPQVSNNMVEHEGQAYFFCSDSCRKEFSSNPDKYISGSSINPGHNSPNHGGGMGCCGMGGGWMRYLYLGMIGLYLILVLTGRV
jgi:YHS domain-containing protein